MGSDRGGPSASVALVDLLQRVEGDLAALRRSGALDDALRRWKTRRDELRSYADAEALIGFLRDPDAEPRAAKDSALAAICVEATDGDQTAATLLLWLMLPGLLRVRQRLATWNALGRDDLDAELLAGVWEAATAVGPATTSVAARLVNRARRRALTAVRRAADWAGRSEPLSTEMEEPEHEHAGGPEDSPFGGRAGRRHLRARRPSCSAPPTAPSERCGRGWGFRSTAPRTVGVGPDGVSSTGSPTRSDPPRFLAVGSPQELPTDTPASPDKERPMRRPL